MPQPIITGTPLTCTFGGLTWPNGQGAFGSMNLNDGTQWQWQQFKYDDDYVQLTPAQLAWRAATTVIGRDRKGRILTLPMRYLEAGTAPSQAFGAQKAKLEQGGQQQLSTDGATFILAEFAAIKNETWVKAFPPFYHAFNLELYCPQPYWHDISSTTYMNAVALASGSATNTNVTYLGSVWTKPVFTLTIPNTNAVAIASIRLQNTMSGDDMTVTFPSPLPASTAAAVTIDSGALSVVDGNGVSYDVSGVSFPLLYGPAGQVQQIRATLTPVSGTATGCTLTCVAVNRWLL